MGSAAFEASNIMLATLAMGAYGIVPSVSKARLRYLFSKLFIGFKVGVILGSKSSVIDARLELGGELRSGQVMFP